MSDQQTLGFTGELAPLNDFGFASITELSLFTRPLLASRLRASGGIVMTKRIQTVLTRVGLDFAPSNTVSTERIIQYFHQSGRIPTRVALLSSAGYGRVAFYLEQAGMSMLGLIALKSRLELARLIAPDTGDRLLDDTSIGVIDGTLNRFGLRIAEPMFFTQDLPYEPSYPELFQGNE